MVTETCPQAELSFRSLFEASPHPYLILRADPAFTIAAVNDRYLSVIGAQREAIVEHGFFEIFPDNLDDDSSNGVSNLHASLERVLSCRRQDVVDVQKYAIPLRDGSGEFEVKYWNLVNTPIFATDGSIAFIIHQVEDITERQHAEADLRISATAFEAQVGIVVTDVNCVILKANQAFTEITGYPVEEIIGQTPRLLKSGRHDAAFYVAMWDSIMTTGVWHGEIWSRRKNGEIYPKWLTITAVKDGNGTTTHYVGTQNDITERKLAEQALLDADRRKDEFLAMLAHELRNPLAPIRNAAHILGRLGLTDPRIKWAQEIIDNQVAHLSRMVDDLLDVSRIAGGKIELKKERLELAALVEQVMLSARPLAEEKGHQLTVRLPKQAVWLEADPVRLSQVLFNLLDNAFKYTQDGGQIDFDACVAGQEIEIKLRDNGTGIPASLVPRVFDLFQQGSRALDRAQGGLGIGLTLVQRIVVKHGGRVEARSDGPGQGSTFTVWLPISDAAPLSLARDSLASSAPFLNIRVLVVDDDHDVAESTGMLLDMEGYGVRIAHTGLDALALIPEYRPQVVLLDIGLKGMDGFETAKRLRTLPHGRDLHLVAVTGYGDAKTKACALESGCDHFLVKPMEWSALSKLLAMFVAPVSIKSSQLCEGSALRRVSHVNVA